VIESLRAKFIPVAIDQHVHRRLKNAEGELFAKVLKQAGRDLGGRSQGVYIFDPAGKLLAFSNTSDPGQIKRLMAKSLTGFTPTAAAAIPHPVPAAAKGTGPPAGTTIVTVTSKVLGGYEKVDGRNTEMHSASLGRDHLWIRRDEAESLAKGSVPQTLTQRLVRYHLIDNTRGEPPFWQSQDLREATLELKDGRLHGMVKLRSADGAREYGADLFGQLVTKDGKLTRFDLVASGKFQGEGRYTRGAPPGKYPFAVSFRLTVPTCAADRVIPGGARGNLAGYLR
jgi:hypothetical protein